MLCERLARGISRCRLVSTLVCVLSWTENRGEVEPKFKEPPRSDMPLMTSGGNLEPVAVVVMHDYTID